MPFNETDAYEDYRTEFKVILNDKLEKEAIGFLNTKGGDIYIGVGDTGEVIGISDSDIDKIQLQIKDRLKNNISPSILGLYEIIVMEKEGIKYIRINLAEGDEKPYYLTRKGRKPDGCFIRIGSAIQKMDQAQIDEMFKNRVAPDLAEKESPRQDLTFTQLKIYFEGAGIPTSSPSFLSGLELYTSKNTYNYFAYLLADTNSVSIRYMKYSGTGIDTLVSYEEYGYVSLLKATYSLLDKIKSENTPISIISNGERISIRPLNYDAAREAIVNAIIHNDWSKEDGPFFQWFSDRLEITSHGGYRPKEGEEDLFRGLSHPRWRVLSRIYSDLGLCNHIGGGINKIIEIYGRSVFSISNNDFVVTLPFKTSNITLSKDTVMTPLRANILKIIKNKPFSTHNEIAKQLKVTPRTIERNIKVLKDNGYLARVGSNKTGGWSILKVPK